MRIIPNKTFYLTNELRKKLREPYGTPIFAREEKVIKKFKEIFKEKKFKKVITIGDYCSLTIPSDVKIFNGRIGRNKKIPVQGYSFTGLNPPAAINKDIWQILKKAIKDNKNVFIKGEEDLLVIPCILLAKNREVIVYGVRDKGICFIEVCAEIKKDVRKILNRFRKHRFKKIVLGGTFGPLHKGHKYFLSMAGYYARQAVIGLCSDEMVKKRKKDWQAIEKFSKRKKVLQTYLNKINIPYEIFKIEDIYGRAVEDKELEAILLTEETFKKGQRINKVRKEKGLKALNYIVLPYILDEEGKKISSSRMRNEQ